MRYKQYPVSGNSMKLISIRSNNRKDIVDDEIIVKMHIIGKKGLNSMKQFEWEKEFFQLTFRDKRLKQR